MCAQAREARSGRGAMPPGINRICTYPGCHELSLKARCERHRALGKWGDEARGTSTERGYGTAWRKLRLVVMQRDCWLCQCPRCKAGGLVKAAQEVDHIKPKAEGGTDALSNLRAVSTECHRRITMEAKGQHPRQAFGADGWPPGGNT
ncbi:MAG: HNH endonuclease signature motif containing protein [Caldimonas sp.]